jgi:hypothetical protein
MSDLCNQELNSKAPLRAGDEDGSVEQASSSDSGNDPRPDDGTPPPPPPR